MQIREADLDRDGAAIAVLLAKYLTPRADAARFEWLYKKNPEGRVRAWLATDQTGVFATAAVFPRRAYVNKIESNVWVFGDFCVSEHYRSLGPAVALQRTLLQACDFAGVPVSYDFPSPTMGAIYKRLGLERFGEIVRMVKILRLDEKLKQHIRYKPLQEALTTIGNAFLDKASIHGRRAGDGSLQIELENSACGQEFDLLAENARNSFDFCVRRSAAYLNWRYLSNPYKKHEIMTARRDGKLLGFVVLSQEAGRGEIVDIFAAEEFIVSSVISKVIEVFRCRGAIAVSAEVIASHPWRTLFNKLGFYARERKPFMVYRSRRGSTLGGLFGANGGSAWFITGGDRDS